MTQNFEYYVYTEKLAVCRYEKPTHMSSIRRYKQIYKRNTHDFFVKIPRKK